MYLICSGGKMVFARRVGFLTRQRGHVRRILKVRRTSNTIKISRYRA